MKLVWPDGLRRFDRQFRDAQRWLDQTVLRDASPYVPKRTGALEQSGEIVPGGGAVRWTAPYAAAVYRGKDLNFSKTAHPLAQALWFEAARARHGQDWVRGVKRKAGGA